MTCDGMSHISLGPQKPDRLRLRVVEHRRHQRPAIHGAGVEVQPVAASAIASWFPIGVTTLPSRCAFISIKQSMTADDCGPRSM
jgi:hypothetical protein